MMSYKFSMNERQGSESISTRKSYLEPVTHYIEHPSESLAYGADWSYDENLFTTGSKKGVLGTVASITMN